MDAQIQVRITNGNDFAIDDRFDGVPYTFPPGATVTIPFGAALHFFGFLTSVDPETREASIDPTPHLDYMARRWGWNTPAFVTNGKAKDYCAKIKVVPVSFTLVETREEDETADLPEPRASAPVQASAEDLAPPRGPGRPRKAIGETA